MLKERDLRKLYTDCEGLATTDHSWDRGGKTKYGATSKFLKSKGRDINKVSNDDIWALILEEFYIGNRVHTLEDDRLKTWHFIQAVNTYEDGIKAMQRSYNSVRRGKLAVDGVIGPNTTKAINRLSKAEVSEMIGLMNADMTSHYIQEAQSDTQYLNMRGWKNRLVKIDNFNSRLV